jgi:hypothetical protein
MPDFGQSFSGLALDRNPSIAYWGAGSTIGPALTFGYVAGLNAAAEPVKAG